MKLPKWLTLALGGVLALVLASCQRGPSAIPKIVKDGMVLIATVPFEPPLLYQRGQEMVGPEAELGGRIVEHIGRELLGAENGSRIQTYWITRSYSSIVAALQNREADMIVAVFGVTEEREQTVDFSEPYYTSELVLITNPAVKDLRSTELKGMRVGVRQSTEVEYFVAQKFPEATTVAYNTLDDAVLALRRGELDAVIDDRYMAAFSLDTVPGVGSLEIAPQTVGKIDVAVAVNRGETELLELVNQVVREVKAEGLYAQWVAEHLGDRLEKVAKRHTERLEQLRMAQEPRRVVIRVSKDDRNPFDIYRMANLNFVLTDRTSGRSYSTSRIDFQGRVGVSLVNVPPGEYSLALPRFNFQAGNINISPADGSQVNISIRLQADNSVVVTKS